MTAITTSPSVQASLASLASTSQLLQQTEQQLSTGQSVNSPSDNAPVYYAAQSFLQQASDLSTVKDNLSTSLTTINATTSSIGSVTEVVQQLQGIASQALATTDTTARAGFAAQYNALLPQLNQLVNNSTFNGTNLLNGASNNLSVNFSTGNNSNLTIPGADVTSNGLGLAPVTNGFATNADIQAVNSQLSSALSVLTSSAASFGSNATLIQTNQDFTSNLINNLQTASSDLTATDFDQEAANLLSLQSQNQFSVISLGISGQLKNATLQLFQGA